MNLSIAIQHHPSRPHLATRVIERLGYPADHAGDEHAEVFVDPAPDAAPSPWRTAREAWRLTPPSCTHRLVIQDDAILCRGFRQRVDAAIAEMPDAPLALFFGVNSYPLNIPAYCDTIVRGERFYAIPRVGWVPCVALVMPRDMAFDLAVFSLPHHQRASVADDEVVMEWANDRGVTAYATAPSLVEHDDAQTSLMGTDATRIRQAVCFIDDHLSLPITDENFAPSEVI